MIVASHRGRPRGQVRPDLSLAPIAAELGRRLGTEVALAPDCIGACVSESVQGLAPGRVLLLENLRFHAGETANDEAFARALAQHGDVYVNDAFGVSHRTHASVVGVPRFCRPAAAGDLLQREVTTLSRVLVNPPAPFVLLLGGAKVADKVGVVSNLLPLVDRLVIGGAMANAFLAAEGVAIGASLAPAEAIDQARRLLAAARARDTEVILPSDLVVAEAVDSPENARVVESVPDGWLALDIGPATRERFIGALADARTVVWNGPMGVFETAAFAAGTVAVAEAIAALGSEAFTVVGGGDTAAAAAMAGITGAVTHVSTGGGASLDLLAGAILPGVAALTDREGSAGARGAAGVR